LDLSIIIVSWNCCSELLNCLDSIYNQTVNFEFEVIVVDNASSDDTIHQVISKYKKVKIIANDKNFGFPKANNQAIKQSQGDFILLLNPDTILLPEVLSICLNKMKEDQEIGALGPRLIYKNGEPQYEAGRRFIKISDLLYQSLYLHVIFPGSRIFNGQLMGEWKHDDDREVDCISGAFMLLRKAVLDQIGLLDEKLFMYFEDVEICHRIKMAGWKIWFQGTQTVIHISARSSRKSNKKLWILEGDVKCSMIEMLYGKKAKFGCRIIIGARSMIRIILWILMLPIKLFKFKNNNIESLNPIINLKLIQWSIKPSIIFKFFPERKYEN